MSELFLMGGFLTASAAAIYVLNSSVGKKGGIPSAPRAVKPRGVADDLGRQRDAAGLELGHRFADDLGIPFAEFWPSVRIDDSLRPFTIRER